MFINLKLKTNQIGISFNDEKRVKSDFIQFDKIISDRGSKYSVTGGKVTGQVDIQSLIEKITSDKKYAKATHHSWAARLENDGQIWEIKTDDGETGAGAVILRILKKQNFVNTMVVVTRWYGGKQLGADRYKHVQDATIYFCSKF